MIICAKHLDVVNVNKLCAHICIIWIFCVKICLLGAAAAKQIPVICCLVQYACYVDKIRVNRHVLNVLFLAPLAPSPAKSLHRQIEEPLCVDAFHKHNGIILIQFVFLLFWFISTIIQYDDGFVF